MVHTIRPGEVVIDDNNWRQHVNPPSSDRKTSSTGFISPDRDSHPFGAISDLFGGQGVSALPSKLMVPESEWVERIKEKTAKKELLSDLIIDSTKRGWRWLNQESTNFCWCYAVVHGFMVRWLKMGGSPIRPSPASVAAPIKNYSNQGGWGTQALEWILKYGVATEEFWPQNKISRQYYESSRENALLHRLVQAYEIRPRSWGEKMSCLLNDIPVPSGYSWMGHEMCSVDAVILPNGEIGCRDLDSYAKAAGTPNFKVLSRSQGTPDDACAIFTTTSY